MLIRVQHLRTQVRPWRAAAERGALSARVEELLNALRGIGLSARGAGFSGCARLCERAVRRLERTRGGLPLPWLTRIAYWLNRAERELRHPAAVAMPDSGSKSDRNP